MDDRKTGLIQTADPRMKRILEIVESIASSRASVLIQGESGTGKELLARYIHALSPRASQRFSALNCAAVPEGLLESELFGHERGAFTGADSRRVGRFEMANHSTFLLDEISEMPLVLQAKLLRVIQEGEVERLGGAAPIKINVRILAATNRDLKDMVRRNQFREDLFYRLNAIPLVLPPLRERPKDIEFLSRWFIEISCRENGIPLKRIGAEASKKLQSWDWPGNVRELKNVIERSVLLSEDTELSPHSIMISDYQESRQEDRVQAGMTVSEMEKVLILKTLEHTGHNRTQAADLLGISIRTLRNKIREYRGCERTLNP
ncbi:MAG: sigma-54-dependent Fis family transcriptional regulator [Bdellovibrionales bacterium]|nr:sigma-54-dependent Fis family transcriptional regulator [Bdellovibrionales bacterium]